MHVGSAISMHNWRREAGSLFVAQAGLAPGLGFTFGLVYQQQLTDYLIIYRPISYGCSHCLIPRTQHRPVKLFLFKLSLACDMPGFYNITQYSAQWHRDKT